MVNFSRFDYFKIEEQLIVCVSAHPVLYNTSLFDYRDVNKINYAWRRVAEVVGVPGVYFVLFEFSFVTLRNFFCASCIDYDIV